MFAFLASLAATALSTVGSVAGAAASMATSVLSGAAGVVGGAGGLLFGAPAAGLTVGQQMAAIAEPGYYGAGGVDVLGGVAASAVKTVDYLGNLAPAAAGIYQIISPPKVGAPATATAIPTVTAPTITRTILPTLSQQPKIMTVGAAAEPEPNYLLYIGLAVLALFLMRKK